MYISARYIPHNAVCSIPSQCRLKGSGLGGMFGAPGERTTGGTNPADPGAGLAALLGGMGSLGAMGPPPVSDPESTYASQLQQLQV